MKGATAHSPTDFRKIVAFVQEEGRSCMEHSGPMQTNSSVSRNVEPVAQSATNVRGQRYSRGLLVSAVALVTVAVSNTSSANPVEPPRVPAGFRSEFANVNGIKVHYLVGGHGDALVLLHGWPQTWFEWHRVMPQLAAKYTVIVPDLRGAGDSDAPVTTTGYETRTMAEDLRGLLDSLGVGSAHIVGHDVGAMVAYPFASKYPTRVKKLVMAEAPIPGIEPVWSQVTSLRILWHFGFHNERATPELLVAGRERAYLVSFFQKFAVNKNAFTEEEVSVFANAYSRSGRMTGGFEWYRAFDADAAYNHGLQRNKLSMPLLMVGGGGFGSTTEQLLFQGSLVATTVVAAVIPGSGHWILEEQPNLFVNELCAFLAGN